MTADNPAGQTGQPAEGRRTATDIPDDPQELAEDIKQTREQVGQTVEALTNKLDPKVQLEETKAQLRETAGRMKGRVSAATGEVARKITDKAGTVGQQVRGTAAKAARNADQQRVPVAVVAGAAVLLAGAWIAWVMRRR
jgi:CHASE3 domain sensor protein